MARNVFFVDCNSQNVSDVNVGDNEDAPMATINAAVGRCVANNNDYIFVKLPHIESVTLDVAGVSIVRV